MKEHKEAEEGPNNQSGRSSGFAAGRHLGALRAREDPTSESLGLKGQLPSVFFFLIFFVLTAGIIAAGLLYYRQHAQHYRAEVERGLSAVAKLKVDELVDWRAERLADASVLYKNASFSGLVRRFFEKPNDSAVRDQVGTWLSHIRAAYKYDRIILLDARCSVRLSTPETPEPVAPHLLKQAPEVLRSGRITFLDFHRDIPDRPIHLSILVPILEEREDARTLGILVLRIDPENHLYPYIKRWPTPSRTAETLIVRRDGNDALFLNELRFQKNTALNLRTPLTNKKTPAAQVALGREGIMEGIDYRGVPVVAALRAVPNSPWYLVARMDISEAYGPLKEMLWVMIVLVCSLLLGAGAGTGSIWRYQRARFYRARFEAAEAMRAVSSRYEALLSAVPDIIMEVDSDKVYVWANQAGLDFFGEDVIGKEADYYFEGEQDTYAMVRPLFNGDERVIYVESWQRRRDGEKRLLAWWCRVLKDKNGQATGTLSSAHDITERERATEALRKSERKFRETVEYMDEGYYSVTPDGFLLDHNQAYNRILGFDIAQGLKGLKTPDFWQNPDDRKQYLDELMTKGFIRNYLVNAKTVSGEKIVVLANSHLVKDEKGRLVRIEGNITDFTERMKADEKLRTSEEKLRTLFETMAQGVVYQTPQGDIILANPAAERILGLGLEQMQGRTSIDPRWRSIHEDGSNFPGEQHPSMVALRTGLEVRNIMMGVFNPKKGDNTWINITAVPQFRPGEDKPFQVYATFEDITERKRAEAALRNKNDELERFTYSVSHDLKSPLVTIRTFLGYAEHDSRKQDWASMDKDIDYIRKAADKMSSLLDELLELSRIGRKVNPSLETPLQEIVQEALDLVAGRITERGVKVEVTKEPILLCGDRPRLVEIFQNLVDNAVKFMGDEPAPRVEIGVEQAGHEIVLFVRDNGIGIDLQHQPKLFGLFEKLDPGTEGTGIGLALVRRIVEVHGGRIWVESEGRGKGTTFHFILAKTRRNRAEEEKP